MHAALSPSRSAVPPLPMIDVVAHRDYLVRFAQRRLRDPMLAEDAVHDVFEAVLAGRASFGGRAALRSWLTAVLKHKIVDAVRRSRRPRLARRRRRCRRRPRRRQSPARSRGPTRSPSSGSCWRARSRGIEALPRRPARRDAPARARGRSTAEVCGRLGISEENLFVRVHRRAEAPAVLTRRGRAADHRRRIDVVRREARHAARQQEHRRSRWRGASRVAQGEPVGARHLDVDVAARRRRA